MVFVQGKGHDKSPYITGTKRVRKVHGFAFI